MSMLSSFINKVLPGAPTKAFTRATFDKLLGPNKDLFESLGGIALGAGAFGTGGLVSNLASATGMPAQTIVGALRNPNNPLAGAIQGFAQSGQSDFGQFLQTNPIGQAALGFLQSGPLGAAGNLLGDAFSGVLGGGADILSQLGQVLGGGAGGLQALGGGAGQFFGDLFGGIGGLFPSFGLNKGTTDDLLRQVGVPLALSFLAQKEAKPFTNLTKQAITGQFDLANQFLGTHRELTAPQTGESPIAQTGADVGTGIPQFGLTAGEQTPLGFAIQNLFSGAVQGFGTPERILERNVMQENIDRNFQSALTNLEEGFAERGSLPGVPSGRRLEAIQDLSEQAALAKSGVDRDLFLKGEEFKRQQADRLLSAVLSQAQAPLQAAGTIAQGGALAGAAGQDVLRNFGDLAQAIAFNMAMSKLGRQGGNINIGFPGQAGAGGAGLAGGLGGILAGNVGSDLGGGLPGTLGGAGFDLGGFSNPPFVPSADIGGFGGGIPGFGGQLEPFGGGFNLQQQSLEPFGGMFEGPSQFDPLFDFPATRMTIDSFVPQKSQPTVF